MVQTCDGTVSGIVVTVGEVCDAETTKDSFKAGPPLFGPYGVDLTARDRLPEVDEATQFLCYSMLEDLCKLIPNSSLYTRREE